MDLKSEYQNRIKKLQNRLAQDRTDGVLLVYPIDVYYYTATRQTATLWVPTEGQPVLLVKKSYERAKQESCVEDIRPFPRSKDFASIVNGARTIGLTFDVLPVQQFQYYGKLLPDVTFVDISTAYRELRSVKSAWELERMRHAGRQLSAVIASIGEIIKPGMREVDLAAEIEMRLRRCGGEGYVRMRAFNQELFHGLVVCGSGAAQGGFFDGAVTGRGLSAAAAHGASTDVLAPDQPILVDYTGVFDGYIVDMTRMFVCGTLDVKLTDAFKVARNIQDKIAAQLKPGAVCSDLFEQSKAMAQEAGLGDFYMGIPGENAKFVGHGVGLELDELPVLAQGFDQPLVAGQVIAVEPKFVFPDLGPVGIENTYAVTASGGEKITPLDDDMVMIASV